MTVSVWESKLAQLVRGERIIVDDEFLNWAGTYRGDYGNLIRTAFNRKRCGIHDAYVAWIAEEAAPSDLSYGEDMLATATM